MNYHKKFYRQIISGAGLVLLMLALLAGGAYLLGRNNYHLVVPYQLYRSAQLSPHRLKQVIHADGIRTVLNLRGANPQRAWYRREISVTKKLGVLHENIRLSAYHLPTISQLRHLVSILENAPKPILVHCESGSDRTGFASALMLLLDGKSLAKAYEQLSWYYGVFSQKSIGYLVLPQYQKWLKQNHWVSTRAHFLLWIQQLGESIS